MKFQRTPLILLAIALLLGALVYLYEVQGKPQREAAQAQTEQLFTFKEEEVRSLTVITPTQTLSFAKTPAARVASATKATQTKPSAEPLVWAMTAPEQAVANDATVAYLLNLLATGKRQQTIAVPAAKQAEFGLDKPMAIAEVKLANQTTHRLIVGKPNFNHSSLYAQADPPAQTNVDRSVVLVSTDFENAVNRPLSAWKATQTDQPKPNPPKPERQKP